MPKENERFDHVLKKALDAHVNVSKYANLIHGHQQRFRRAAYRFTKYLMIVQRDYHNEFVQWVHSEGIKLDEWLDVHFSPIEAMLESRKGLMEAIDKRMTEKAYVAQGLVLWTRRQDLAGRPPQTAVARQTPDAPLGSMSDSEKVQFLTKQCDALRSENKEVKRDNRALRADMERLTRQLNNLLNRLGKSQRARHSDTSEPLKEPKIG